MTTKLTLTVEKEIIKKAKLYARKTGRSLSELVESHFENLLQEKQEKEKAGDSISPRLKKIVGSVKLPKGFDERKELRKALEKKYL